MRILHTVESYYPAVTGMAEVAGQISERLVKLGHQVTVATTKLGSRRTTAVNGVKIVEFAIFGNLVRGISGQVDQYLRFLLSSRFDIITNFAAQQWATDLVFGLLDSIKAKKIFVPTGFSGLKLPEYRDYFGSMTGWMKKYDMNVFLAIHYRDSEFASEQGIKKRVLIPNGAAKDEFLAEVIIDIRQFLEIPQNHFLILLVASHTGMKGHNEAIEIFSQAEIKNATLLIIGEEQKEGCGPKCKLRERILNILPTKRLWGKRLIVTSLPRSHTVAAYKAADLFLFPSNIECSPIVLFECLASKTPFLTTDVGNAKEIINWSGGGILLPTRKDERGYSFAKVDQSARILEDIYHDLGKRELMRRSGFSVWQKKFTWEKIAQEYEKLYKSLLAN